MNASDIFKRILKEQRGKQTEIAKELNVSRQAVWTRIHKKALLVENASEMYRLVGYKMIVVPASRETQANEYEID